MSTQTERQHSAPKHQPDTASIEAALEGEYRPEQIPQVRDATEKLFEYVQDASQQTDLIREGGRETIAAVIADLDRKISERLNAVFHHPEFQEMESSWRGLQHLVQRSETDEKLQIKVLNIAKHEVASTLRVGAAWDKSILFRKIYNEYDKPGHAPFGTIVGDYYFDNSPKDIAILKGMAGICAASLCPFIAAASPAMLNMKEWEEFNHTDQLTTRFMGPEYAEWRELRKTPDSRFVGLTLPRFLARNPYSAQTVTGAPGQFLFHEQVAGPDHEKYLWANAAYAMGGNIARAFSENGWCVQIRGRESGGAVYNLPIHTFETESGTTAMKNPTEVTVGDRHELELANCGFMSIRHWENNVAVFDSAQSINAPDKFYDDDASASSALAARIPYLLATSRFAHYFKSVLRAKVGSNMEREDLEKFLGRWLQHYVCDPSTAGDERKRLCPLADASVSVVAVAGSPGAYDVVTSLRPHYQMERVNITMKLVARVKEQR